MLYTDFFVFSVTIIKHQKCKQFFYLSQLKFNFAFRIEWVKFFFYIGHHNSILMQLMIMNSKVRFSFGSKKEIVVTALSRYSVVVNSTFIWFFSSFSLVEKNNREHIIIYLNFKLVNLFEMFQCEIQKFESKMFVRCSSLKIVVVNPVHTLVSSL